MTKLLLVGLKIQNFKSYKLVQIQDLNKNFNLIIGKNGHGKSNFFEALQFLLSTKYKLAKKKDKQDLEHSGAELINNEEIEVEGVFDNSQLDYVLKDKTIKFSRKWSSDYKDEYYMNGRHLSSKQVSDFLESFGFAQSNPYNIVHQGTVEKISIKSQDINYLYQLLEEVSGLNIYYKKRQQGEQYLNESDNQTNQCQQKLEFINDRINEIKNEQKYYQKLIENEKMVQTIQFQFYELSIQEIELDLDNQNSQIAILQDKMRELADSANKNEQEINRLEMMCQQNQQQYETINDQIQWNQSIQSDRSGQIDKENYVIGQIQSQIQQLQKQLEQDQQQINCHKHSSKQNKKLSQQIEEQVQKQTKLQKDIILVKKQMMQVETANEIQNQTASQNKQAVQHLKEKIEEFNVVIQELEGQKNNGQIIINDLQNKQKEMGAVLSNNQKQVLDEKYKLELQENQKLQKLGVKLDLVRKINYVSNQIKASKDELQYFKMKLVKRNFGNGKNINLDEIVQIRLQMKSVGIIGQIYDVIEVEQPFDYLVGLILEQRIFDFIVDHGKCKKVLKLIADSELETEIGIQLINQKKNNREGCLQVQYDYESLRQQNVYSISQFVKVKDEFRDHKDSIEKVVNDILGGYFLCENQEIAADLSSKYKEGQFMDQQGNLFYNQGLQTVFQSNNNESLFDLVDHYLIKHEELQLLRLEVDELKSNLKVVSSELVNLEKKYNDDLKVHYQFVNDQNELENQIEQVIQQQQYQINQLNEIEQRIEFVQVEVYKKQGCLNQYQQKSQKSKNKYTIEQLVIQLQGLEGQYKKVVEQLGQLKTKQEQTDQQSQQENEKKKNIVDGQTEIDKLQKILELKQTGLQGLKSELEKKKEENKDNQEQIVKIKEQKSSYQNEQVVLNNQQQKLNKTKQQVSQEIQLLKSKESQLMDFKKDYLMSKSTLEFDIDYIKELQDKSKSELMRLLESKKQQNIKKYTEIDRFQFSRLEQNEKNYQQYIQRLETSKQNQQLIRQDLIEKIDNKSKRTIQKLFIEFKNNFNKYFKELVSDGESDVHLITNQRYLNENHQSSVQSDGSTQIRKEQKQGIKISVCFKMNQNSIFNKNEMVNINQLSGGQKTVVSICILLALQKCNPAPFYVFDEIDAALDPVYRQNIKNLIEKNKNNAQYFITTFKSELLSLEDSQIYNVHLDNNVSEVERINIEQAMEMIQS